MIYSVNRFPDSHYRSRIIPFQNGREFRNGPLSLCPLRVKWSDFGWRGLLSVGMVCVTFLSVMCVGKTWASEALTLCFIETLCTDNSANSADNAADANTPTNTSSYVVNSSIGTGDREVRTTVLRWPMMAEDEGGPTVLPDGTKLPDGTNATAGVATGTPPLGSGASMSSVFGTNPIEHNVPQSSDSLGGYSSGLGSSAMGTLSGGDVGGSRTFEGAAPSLLPSLWTIREKQPDIYLQDQQGKLILVPNFTLQQFEELLQLRRQTSRSDAMASWSIQAISTTGTVAEDRKYIELLTEYTIKTQTDELVRIPLLMKGAVFIQDESLAGTSEHLLSYEESEGGFVCRLRGAAEQTHRLRLRFQLPLTETAQGIRLHAQFPRSTYSILQIDLPPEVELVSSGSVDTTALAVSTSNASKSPESQETTATSESPDATKNSESSETLKTSENSATLPVSSPESEASMVVPSDVTGQLPADAPALPGITDHTTTDNTAADNSTTEKPESGNSESGQNVDSGTADASPNGNPAVDAAVENAVSDADAADGQTISPLQVRVAEGGTLLTVSDAKRVGQRSQIILRGQGGPCDLTWAREKGTQALVSGGDVYSNIRAVVYPQGEIRFTANMQIHRPSERIGKIRIRLPRGAVLVPTPEEDAKHGYTVTSMEDISTDISGCRLVEIQYAEDQIHSADVALTAKLGYETLVGATAVELGGFEVLGMPRQSGEMMLLGVGNWKAIPESLVGAKQKEDLYQTTQSREPDLLGTFEFYTQPFSLPVRLLPRQPHLSVSGHYRVFVTEESLQLETVLEGNVTQAELRALDFQFSGWTLDQVSGDGITPSPGYVDEAQMLHIPLQQPISGHFGLRVTAHQALGTGPQPIHFVLPQPMCDSLGSFVLNLESRSDLLLIPQADQLRGLVRIGRMSQLDTSKLGASPQTITIPTSVVMPSVSAESRSSSGASTIGGGNVSSSGGVGSSSNGAKGSIASGTIENAAGSGGTTAAGGNSAMNGSVVAGTSAMGGTTTGTSVASGNVTAGGNGSLGSGEGVGKTTPRVENAPQEFRAIPLMYRVNPQDAVFVGDFRVLEQKIDLYSTTYLRMQVNRWEVLQRFQYQIRNKPAEYLYFEVPQSIASLPFEAIFYVRNPSVRFSTAMENTVWMGPSVGGFSDGNGASQGISVVVDSVPDAEYSGAEKLAENLVRKRIMLPVPLLGEGEIQLRYSLDAAFLPGTFGEPVSLPMILPQDGRLRQQTCFVQTPESIFALLTDPDWKIVDPQNSRYSQISPWNADMLGFGGVPNGRDGRFSPFENDFSSVYGPFAHETNGSDTVDLRGTRSANDSAASTTPSVAVNSGRAENGRTEQNTNLGKKDNVGRTAELTPVGESSQDATNALGTNRSRIAPSGHSDHLLCVSTTSRRNILPLELRHEDATTVETAIVERGWVRTWLAGNVREDHAVFMIRNNTRRNLTVELPPGILPGNVRVWLDGRLIHGIPSSDMSLLDLSRLRSDGSAGDNRGTSVSTENANRTSTQNPDSQVTTSLGNHFNLRLIVPMPVDVVGNEDSIHTLELVCQFLDSQTGMVQQRSKMQSSRNASETSDMSDGVLSGATMTGGMNELKGLSGLSGMNIQIPHLGTDIRVHQMYWELVLPESEYLLSGPTRCAPEFVYDWNGMFSVRRPTLSTTELETWSHANFHFGPVSRVNRYLFSSVGQVTECGVRTVTRSSLVVLASGVILLIGLSLIYLRWMWRPITLLGLSVVLFMFVFLTPDLTILSLQASIPGWFAIVLAWIIWKRLPGTLYRNPLQEGDDSEELSLDSAQFPFQRNVNGAIHAMNDPTEVRNPTVTYVPHGMNDVGPINSTGPMNSPGYAPADAPCASVAMDVKDGNLPTHGTISGTPYTETRRDATELANNAELANGSAYVDGVGFANQAAQRNGGGNTTPQNRMANVGGSAPSVGAESPVVWRECGVFDPDDAERLYATPETGGPSLLSDQLTKPLILAAVSVGPKGETRPNAANLSEPTNASEPPSFVDTATPSVKSATPSNGVERTGTPSTGTLTEPNMDEISSAQSAQNDTTTKESNVS